MIYDYKIKKHRIFTFCLAVFWMISSAQVCPPIKGAIKIIPTPVIIPCAANVVATPSSQYIETGKATNITLTSAEVGTSFTWTATQTGATGALAGSGNKIVQTLIKTGTNSGLVTYTVTPTLGNCSGTPIKITVLVSDPPHATSLIAFTDVSLSQANGSQYPGGGSSTFEVGTATIDMGGAGLVTGDEITLEFQCYSYFKYPFGYEIRNSNLPTGFNALPYMTPVSVTFIFDGNKSNRIYVNMYAPSLDMLNANSGGSASVKISKVKGSYISIDPNKRSLSLVCPSVSGQPITFK